MTEAPPWLDRCWRRANDVPDALQVGTIEDRAVRLHRLAKSKSINSVKLKVLTLDLVRAVAERRAWSRQVEALAVRVLGLRQGHEAGRWNHSELERRGRKPEDFEAWNAAALIDHQCFERFGKVLSQRSLVRELRRMGLTRDELRLLISGRRIPPPEGSANVARGFKTSQSRISKWRKESYGQRPGSPTYVPPGAPTFSREEELASPLPGHFR